MTNWNRTTAEIVAEIEREIRARGRTPASAERDEGDGVWTVWIEHGTEGDSSRSIDVGGNDTGMDPGVDLYNGLGAGHENESGADTTMEEAIGWLTGRPYEEPADPDTLPTSRAEKRRHNEAQAAAHGLKPWW